MRKYLFSTLMLFASISLFATSLSQTKECATAPGWDGVASWQPMMGYADVGSNLSSAFFLAEGTFAGTGVGNIPDKIGGGCGDPSGAALEISFNVTGMDGDLLDISLSLAMVHTWMGDVRAELVAPNGTSHIIFSRTGAITATNCGENANLGGTYNFTDAAAGGNWWTVSAPLLSGDNMPSGDYRTTAAGPQAVATTSPETSLITAFSGVPDLNGTWILRVYDYGAGDTGSVSAANLSIETEDPAPAGCLTATWGLYPAATYTPLCFGVGTIVTDAYAGEYSNVNVTAGTEYTFGSSIATDFLTISNAAGTTVIASGLGSVTWTPSTSEVVRFYTHADAACASSTVLRSRTVECGEPFGEPEYDCFQGDGLASNGPEDGNGINPTSNFRVADDFTVATGETFSLEYVRMNVLTASNVNSATLNIRADAAGMPGAVLHTATMAPTTQTLIGGAFGFNLHQLEFVLAVPIDLTEGVYWLEPTATNTTVGTVYWEVTSTGTDGSVAYNSNTSGVSWVANAEGMRTVFFVAGVCEEVVPPVDGCLEADNGQWPSGAAFVPACYGSTQNITTAGWTGEYSLVAVTTGTEYTFSVSDPTYFITIGNEAGTTVLTSGTGSVTWTADMTGNVRFYTHFNSDCDFDSETFLTRSVSCGQPIEFDEPAFDCFQGDGGMSALENGYGVTASDIYRVADDFVVDAGTEFSLQQITLNMLSASDVTNVVLNIRSNNAGAPGDVVNTATMVPSTSEVYGTAFGFNAYRLEFNLATPFELEEGTYWLELTATNATAGPVYWEMTTLGSTGAPVQLSNTSGATWVPDDSGLDYNAIFYVAGECGEATPDNNDECEDAIAVSCGETVTGSTTEATDSGGNEANDVFYTYTGTGVEEIVTVSLCGSSFDTYLRVFSDCTMTEEIEFNDDACDLQSELSFVSDGTSTYVIMVEGFGANSGDFTMAITCEVVVPPTDYCEPVLDCTDGDVINNVTFAGIDNDSDCSPGGYGDYTAMMAEVEAGETYSMAVTVGAGWTYEATMVWIDFNNDFIFDPVTEYFFIGSDPGTTNMADITIPAGTPDGDYRLRVRVGAVNPELNDLSILACDEETVYGETEDYTLRVGEGGGPIEECEQIFMGDLFNGVGFINTGAEHYRAANDVEVDANRYFDVETITFDVVTLGGEPTTFDLYYYEDATGPGTQVGVSQIGVVPSTITPNGEFGTTGFPVYTVTLTPTVQRLNGDADGSKFWVGITADFSADGQNVYWVSSQYTSNPDSMATYQSADAGATWYIFDDGTGINVEGFMTVTGTCGELGVSDLESFDFAYYPNPVKDELNITSAKLVESVSVYNLAGQQISTQKLNVTNGKVSTSALSPGVYVFRAVLEGGQVETFKVIKK